MSRLSPPPYSNHPTDFTPSLKGDKPELNVTAPEPWASVSGASMLWLVERLQLPVGTVHTGFLHLLLQAWGLQGAGASELTAQSWRLWASNLLF